MATFVVLGGGGSFGIHTSLYLLEQGHRVWGIGRRPLRPEPFTLNIQERDRYLYSVFHVTYQTEELLTFLDSVKPEYIVNFAAQGEGAASWTDSWRFFETNCVGLSRLVEGLIAKPWLKRFIHIGTSEMYGSVSKAANEGAPVHPSSPYAASKLAFDFYLESVHKFRGFPMTIIRPSNAYCPGQLLHRIIPRTIWCGLTGHKLPLQGRGHAQKSYIHARDLARAIALAAGNDISIGRIYNVGPLNPIEIRLVVEMTINAMGLKFEDVVEEKPDRLGQDSRYWLDSKRILQELNWSPQVNWKQGLTEMVEWGRKYIDQIRDWPVDYVLAP